MATMLVVCATEEAADDLAAWIEQSSPVVTVLTANEPGEAVMFAEFFRPIGIIVEQEMAEAPGATLMPGLAAAAPHASILVSHEAGSAGGFEANGGLPELSSWLRETMSSARVSAKQPPAERQQHRIINKVTALVVGLRAFEADLRAHAGDSPGVSRILDEYVERLMGDMQDVADYVVARSKVSEQRW